MEPAQQSSVSHDEKTTRMVLAPNEGLPVSDVDAQTTPDSITGKLLLKWKSFERQLVAYNLEARGIQRVESDERHDLRSLGYTQIAMLWFSINLAANNITLGMLGPAVFYLGFLDSCMCAVFGMLVGCLPVAYIATLGPRSGNRTMILARWVSHQKAVDCADVTKLCHGLVALKAGGDLKHNCFLGLRTD
jgi:hypothetical protein